MSIQYFGPASEPDYDRWMDDGNEPETSVCPGISYWCGDQVDDPDALYCPVHAREAKAVLCRDSFCLCSQCEPRVPCVAHGVFDCESC